MADAGTYQDVDWRPRSRYLAVVTVMLVVVNVFTFLYHITAAAAFNGVSNAVGIIVVIYSVHVWLDSKREFDASSRYVLVATALAGVSFLVNMAVASPIDTVKYLAIFVAYAAGRSCPGPSSATERYCLYALAALPIVFGMVGSSKVFEPESVAYLPNANTAALYFAAVLFALAPQLGSWAVILQFLNAALMNKVGPAVATLAAMSFCLLVPLRRGSLVTGMIVIAAVAAGGWVAHMLGALDRLTTAYDSVKLILELEPATIAAMSYKDLVVLTGTTDLSAFFRIIHWSNVWNLYTSHGFPRILFGYGAGQTRFMAYAPLAPHNDYLRIIAEYGLVNVLVFVSFLIHVVRGIKLMAARVLFIVLLIYMSSENLLDNFTSMTLYFAYAGRLSVASVQSISFRYVATEGKHYPAPV